MMGVIQYIWGRFFWMLWRFFLDITIVGEEHLKEVRGPVIFAPNHKHLLDPFLVGAAIVTHSHFRWIRFMTADHFFWNPFFTPFIILWGGFPARRGRGLEKALALPRTILKQGGALVMFIEGKRVFEEALGKPKRGTATLMCELGVPTIPVAIYGSWGIKLFDFFRPKRKRITIVFTKPISAKATEKIETINTNLMKAIAGAYTQAIRIRDYGFAFIVHGRDTTDLVRVFPITNFLPEVIKLWIMRLLPPLILSEITGLKGKDGVPIRGWLIAVPLSAKQMWERRELALQKIRKALILSRRYGAKIVGLGALTAPISKGGLLLKDISQLSLTTGNTFTALITLEAIEIIISRHFSKEPPIIGIFGATGSIGQIVARKISQRSLSKLILVGRSEEKIKRLADDIVAERNTKIALDAGTEMEKLKEADIVVVATSGVGTFLDGSHLKRGAFIYDLTQPRNIRKSLIQERPDLTIIDGGLVSTPGVDYGFDFGLPQGETFAYLAETLILAHHKYQEHFSLGNVDAYSLEKIKELRQNLPYGLKHFYSFVRRLSI